EFMRQRFLHAAGGHGGPMLCVWQSDGTSMTVVRRTSSLELGLLQHLLHGKLGLERMHSYILHTFLPTKEDPICLKSACAAWREYAQGDIRKISTAAMLTVLDDMSKIFLALSEKRMPEGAKALFESDDFMREVGVRLSFFVRIRAVNKDGADIMSTGRGAVNFCIREAHRDWKAGKGIREEDYDTFMVYQWAANPDRQAMLEELLDATLKDRMSQASCLALVPLMHGPANGNMEGRPPRPAFVACCIRDPVVPLRYTSSWQPRWREAAARPCSLSVLIAALAHCSDRIPCR
ncbi:unnamed protein product, partial [Prorocentrum cordatum]